MAADSPDVPVRVSRRSAIGSIVAAAIAPAALADVLVAAKPAAAAPLGSGVRAVTRKQGTTTQLADGRLLVVGGIFIQPLSSVQIFDPSTGAWFDAAPLNVPRYDHAAALLPDGRVLVCGGIRVAPLSHVEIYDPYRNVWTPAPSMPHPRHQHMAASTSAGVVVTGGKYLNSAPGTALFTGSGWLRF